ncbi:MAG: polyribonucleotide nucleotidyltransferase, partial [Planctomycetota bacterium]
MSARPAASGRPARQAASLSEKERSRPLHFSHFPARSQEVGPSRHADESKRQHGGLMSEGDNSSLPYTRVERSIGNKVLSIECGRYARQAAGAAMVQLGETVVFVAVASGPRPGHLDFFPLTVDYREKTSAAGKFPGGFRKREGAPSMEEILSCRIIDRSIRPLFPDGYSDEVSVYSIILSADQENEPDVLALVGASTALSVSQIPFMGPIAAVRVGLVNDEFIANPTLSELQESKLNLVVAGTRDNITMVESAAKEVSEETILDALEFGHEAIKQIIGAIDELVEKQGKEKTEFEIPVLDEELLGEMRDKLLGQIKEKLHTPGKFARKDAIRAVFDEYIGQKFPEDMDPDERATAVREAKDLFEKLKKEAIRAGILAREREDGRGLEDIREINADLAILPRTHGSACFTRGETQAVVTTTLGTPADEQRVDGLKPEYKKKFMLHYNFPAFSVGESWPNRGPKRREIGHGALAEKALEPVIPDPDKFPYTIRIISDILESNGSSSMASVCGGTLAMMDAGVPIRQPVAGIAMGLVVEDGEVRILSDILGSEDHNGDMDFKVAGTQFGITALQMDIKIAGISTDILKEALEQAREGRREILRRMLISCGLRAPRPELSKYAPRLIRIKIDVEKIGAVIGPGGKIIRRLQEETDTNIEVEDDGTVTVSAVGEGKAEKAVEMIEALTAEVEMGKIYEGRVVSIRDFGAFIEILPGKDGLCHVSEWDTSYIKDM